MWCFRLTRAAPFLVAPLLVACLLGWRHLPRLFAMQSEPSASPMMPSQPVRDVSAEEWTDASNDFAALTDATLMCTDVEMPAYWRLLKWTVRQSINELQNMARANVRYGDLVNMPSRLRGKLMQIDMHVCRILANDAPENDLGIDTLYEVWGWSQDSRGSLYVVLTPELPTGMETGEVVHERATVYGYFCKVQGYFAASATPQSFPSAAPLLIGRMVRYEAPATVIANVDELWRTGAGLLLIISFVGLLARRPLWRIRADSATQQVISNDTADLEAWLDLEGLKSVAPHRG